MPAGLTVTLTRGELLDLVRFLSELGKPGQYEGSSAALARRWRVLVSLPQGAAADEELDAIGAADTALAWAPAYSTVAGILPVAALVAVQGESVAFAHTQVDVSTSGFLTLVLNSPRGLRLWVDGGPAPADDESLLELEQGVHTLVFRIDLAERGDLGLSVEFSPAVGSSARFQPMRGR